VTTTLERTATTTVEAAALKLAAQWAARALPTRAPHPSLTGTLLATTEDGNLTATAWDWTTLCSAEIDADEGIDDGIGTILVNGHLLAEVAARLTGAVTLDLDGSELHLRSGGGRSKYRLRLMRAEEYPPSRPAPVPVGTVKKLGEAVGRVAYAAAVNPPAGTNLDVVAGETVNGKLRLHATDRYRMALAEVEWDGPDLEFAVSARRLAELTRQFGDWDIRIGIDPDRLGLTAGGRTAVLSQVGGKYLTPTMSDKFFVKDWAAGHADLDRADLLEALADASPTAQREQHAGGNVTLTFGPGEVDVQSSSAETGAATSAAGCHLDGPERTEIFDLGLLVETLKAIPDDQLRISFAPKPGMPTLFSPVVDGRSDLANSHIVMPKRTKE
jgi:DNA polymerase-3 subunit beta